MLKTGLQFGFFWLVSHMLMPTHALFPYPSTTCLSCQSAEVYHVLLCHKEAPHLHAVRQYIHT